MTRWRVVRDEHGFACAIARGEYHVLQLNPGTERNEQEVDGVVAKLNWIEVFNSPRDEHNSLAPERRKK